MTLDRVRQSLRTLARQKRFVATAVACLGIAIALNTTMYSVLDALISPHSDVRDPDRLHGIVYFGDYKRQIPLHEKEAALRSASFYEGMAKVYWNTTDAPVAERGREMRDINIVTVSPTWFALHGLHARGGRLLDERDADDQTRPIVIGERLWEQLFPEKERFEPAEILVGGVGRRIIGIVPKNAGFPMTDVWQLPTAEQARLYAPTTVRLKKGVTVAQADAELRVLSQRFRAITGEGLDAGWRIRPEYVGNYREWNFHYALIGSVFAVLLIACESRSPIIPSSRVPTAR